MRRGSAAFAAGTVGKSIEFFSSQRRTASRRAGSAAGFTGRACVRGMPAGNGRAGRRTLRRDENFAGAGRPFPALSRSGSAFFGKMLLRNFSHNRAATSRKARRARVLHIFHRFFHTVMSTPQFRKNDVCSAGGKGSGKRRFSPPCAGGGAAAPAAAPPRPERWRNLPG